MLELVFLTCSAALVWAFLGYPVTMLIRAAVKRPAAMRRGTARPTVSVVLAVRNAADMLEQRIANLLDQDYPIDEILIGCNGSTDDTELVAQRIAALHPTVRTLTSPAEEGKAGAINRVAAVATGEILLFADARQRFDRRAVRRLLRPFRDPAVGGVTGRLLIADSKAASGRAVGSYWKVETRLRMAEARTGSVVGATGAIYAVRRSVFVPLPPAVILDDLYLPLALVMRGSRMTMAPRAIAWDVPHRKLRAEHQRRVRTLVGNIELLRLMPGVLSPFSNPIFFRFVSHKLLRLLTPVLCLGIVVTGLLATALPYRFAAASLLGVYVLGALGLIIPARVLALPSAFLMLHTAGVAALLRPDRGAADVWTVTAPSGPTRSARRPSS